MEQAKEDINRKVRGERELSEGDVTVRAGACVVCAIYICI